MICDCPFSGHLDQSATGKMIVLTVGSFQVFEDKFKSDLCLLCRTYFFNCIHKFCVLNDIHRLCFSQSIEPGKTARQATKLGCCLRSFDDVRGPSYEVPTNLGIFRGQTKLPVNTT